MCLLACTGYCAEKALTFSPTLQAIPGESNQGTSFSNYRISAKQKFGFTLSEPKQFSDNKRIMMFTYPQKKSCGERSGATYETLLISKDNECAIALVGLSEIENSKRTESRQLISDEIHGSLNALTKDAQASINTDNYVTAISASMAKNTANADKAYLVDFPKVEQFGDLAAWTHCQGIYFEKQGKPMFCIKVLYTDKGYSNMAKYLPAAFSIFKYNDNKNKH